MNACHFQTVLTTKAARSVIAGRGRAIVEFGLRRTPGVDAGMKAARCTFLAGATMSSNVLAERSYGIPATGTMAHSYVVAFPREIDAFRAFARAFPENTTLSSTRTTPSPAPTRRSRWERRWRLGGTGWPACDWTAATF